MNLPQNNWPLIRAFYRYWTPEFESTPKNEWAIDAYAWDRGGMITLTPIERMLWHDIRACDAVLYPQYPVGRFFVDFGNPAAKVAVECDGAAYHLDKQKDARRDAELERMGWSVYRISGSDCYTDSDEETGAPGRARSFMRQVCDENGISRRTREGSPRHLTKEEFRAQFLHRLHRMAGAPRCL